MAVTVVCVVATHNLAVGVIAGCLAALGVFARRVAGRAELAVSRAEDGSAVRYAVSGDLFFASANGLADRFDYAGDPDRVVVDLGGARLWDASAVAVLDAIAAKYAQRGKHAEVSGLTGPGAELHTRLSERG